MNLANGVSNGNSDAMRNQFQSGMDQIQAESMQDELDKAERDRRNAFTTGYQNSADTVISSMAQNKITF